MGLGSWRRLWTRKMLCWIFWRNRRPKAALLHLPLHLQLGSVP